VADAPGRRLDPPSRGAYGDARGGWEYCGAWGDYTGVAVGRHWFLTAKHVGGHIGGVFVLQGKEHRAVARTEIADADLVLWQVDGDFANWAPLHSGLAGDQLPAVVVGRGLAAAGPVMVAGRRVGWRWGALDGRMSWGATRLAGKATLPGGEAVLVGAFAPDGCTVATGDSGGGVFIRENGRWALAGICRSTGNAWQGASGRPARLVASLWDSQAFLPLRPDGTVEMAARGRPTGWMASRVADHALRIRTIVDGRPGPDWHRFVTVVGAAVVFALVSLARLGWSTLRARRRG